MVTLELNIRKDDNDHTLCSDLCAFKDGWEKCILFGELTVNKDGLELRHERCIRATIKNYKD